MAATFRKRPVDNATNPKARLLAIDDNQDSAELVARIASRCGYDTGAVSTPDEIRERIREWKPDVLALDLSMPELNGVELLALLQEHGFKGKVLIISGHEEWMRSSAARLAEARGLQVIGDMQKPLDTARLQQMLTQLQHET
jgi:DNA-binding NtrC family response regulator